MAPLTRRRKRALAAAVPEIDPADHLSRLPNEVLAQILSFLPAQEAVQTCVLARSWRDVWKMTTRLLIRADDNRVQRVKKFVDGLLRVRLDGIERAPLHACEITVDPFEDGDLEEICFDKDDMDRVNTWIRRVLDCKVLSLQVNIQAYMDLAAYLKLEPVTSRHLARLQLEGVRFMCRNLDLSRCPALEYLGISKSILSRLDKITCPSLKRLVITSCETTQDELYTIQICVPRLVSLQLEVSDDWTPLLESMPDLVGARVEFLHAFRGGGNNFDIESAQNATECFLLDGLAEAEDLVMMASFESTEIFTSDLRWCPSFPKLKTLVLNDLLCEPADGTLACIIGHAPVLEKFTFIFSKEWRGKHIVQLKGHLDETVKLTMSNWRLKKVKVRCRMVDEKVLNFLNFFGKLNICFQIRVTKQ